MSKYIPIIWIAAVIIGIPLMIRANWKDKGQLESKQKKSIHNRYVFYYNNIFTRSRFRRIVQQFMSLACYDLDTVKENAVKLFEKTLLFAIAIPIFVMVVFKNILLMLLSLVLSYVYYNATVERKIDFLYAEIIRELSTCIQSIRERYMESSSVATAVANADTGKYLGQTIDKIHEMLTAVDMDDKLNLLCRTMPVRLVKTLAIICYITQERGDIRSDEGGSAFSDELVSLRQECDMEIRRLERIRIGFNTLPKIALAGVVLEPFVEMYLINSMPGLASVLNGMYGMVEKTVLILLTGVAYYIISTFMRPVVVSVVDRIQWIDNLSKSKRIEKFLANIKPKKYRTRAKWRERIAASVSAKTENYIYTSKVIFSVIAFVASLLLLIGFTFTVKYYTWNSYKTFAIIESTKDLTEKADKRLRQVDYEYMVAYPKMQDSEITSIVESKVPELDALEVDAEVQRMSKKYDTYYSLGFKWWYFVVALLASVVGWFIPEISLALRKKMVTFEASEDVLQLQTLMLSLSQTDMSVYDVLYWLEKQSTVHKMQFAYASQMYISDPMYALAELKQSVGAPELKRLVSKLEAAVYTISLKEAFSDLALDKTQLLRMREMAQDAEISSKKNTAQGLAQAPFMLVIFGGFVMPILILGISELMGAMGGL